MKGYVYTMFAGADPGAGWQLNDPIFGKVPTLGACMPNIRRLVLPGDYIFVVSGRVEGLRQYVVGGFEVSEKINALAAFDRFPHLRQHKMPDGSLAGNIIVTQDGKQTPTDYHSNFEKRLENYVVGRKPITLEKPPEVKRARDESLDALGDILSKKGDRISDVIGRWRKLDGQQIHKMINWMESIKAGARP